MVKAFNVNGACKPNRHYMVDLKPRLAEIKIMVDHGEYFTIHKARQYGKTTTLRALADYLKNDYVVISLDFQKMSFSDFENESAFVNGLAREISRRIRRIAEVPDEPKAKLYKLASENYKNTKMAEIFDCFSDWCEQSEMPIVLIIDEVDTATNNQVFLDFLAQLRADYLDNDVTPTFQSVILAGVYDVRNIRRKIRPEDAHKTNSPWNTREGNEENASLLSFDDCPWNHRVLAPYDIASDFDVDMSFSTQDIVGMLREYETDYQTGMNVEEISGLLYDYTSGYPFLVSRLCKLIDEKICGEGDFEDKKTVWTKAGVLEAVKRLLTEKNTLFESLIGKLNEYQELKNMIYLLLFQGQSIAYSADDPATDMALMFGFAKVESGTVQIANRIFETRLYNYFLTLPEVQSGDMYKLALRNKNQFIQNGQLNMKRILEKFVEYFDDVYGDQNQKFYEEDGRRYFMLYLKPIINGTGNYYVEARTRNQERTDLIVDFHGVQYIIEMKVWHGNAYHERGEGQLSDYLDHYHLKEGYMLSFCFNQKKEIGVKEIILGDKVLIEAVV